MATPLNYGPDELIFALYGAKYGDSGFRGYRSPYFLHEGRRDPRAYNSDALAQLLFIANNQARAELGVPGMFALDKNGKPYLTPNFFASVGYRTQINLSAMAVRTVFKGSQNTFDVLRIFAEALIAQANDNQYLISANKELASRMHDALKNSYGQRVERRRQVPSYARRNRLSGRLRTAIAARDMVVGNEHGISYINQDRLNLEARHWQRINFGVRGAPGARQAAAQSKAPEKFSLKVGGRSLGRVGLSAKPRPPMYLPPGFWLFIGSTRSAKTNKTIDVWDDESKEERDARRGSASRGRRADLRAKYGINDRSAGAREDDASLIRNSQTFSGLRRAMSKTYRRPLLPGSIDNPVGGRGYGPVSNPITYKSRRSSDPLFKRKKTIEVTNPNRGVRRTQQMFVPRQGSRARYPTSGVVAANFIDGGFQALQTHIDRVYTDMVADMQEAAEDTAASKAVKRVVEEFRPGMLLRDFRELAPRRRR